MKPLEQELKEIREEFLQFTTPTGVSLMTVDAESIRSFYATHIRRLMKERDDYWRIIIQGILAKEKELHGIQAGCPLCGNDLCNCLGAYKSIKRIENAIDQLLTEKGGTP